MNIIQGFFTYFNAIGNPSTSQKRDRLTIQTGMGPDTDVNMDIVCYDTGTTKKTNKPPTVIIVNGIDTIKHNYYTRYSTKQRKEMERQYEQSRWEQFYKGNIKCPSQPTTVEQIESYQQFPEAGSARFDAALKIFGGEHQ